MKNPNRINVEEILSPLENITINVSELKINDLAFLNEYRDHLKSYMDIGISEAMENETGDFLLKINLYLSLEIEHSDAAPKNPIVYINLESVFSGAKDFFERDSFNKTIIRGFLPEIIKQMRSYTQKITSISDLKGYELPLINPAKLLEKKQELLLSSRKKTKARGTDEKSSSQ